MGNLSLATSGIPAQVQSPGVPQVSTTRFLDAARPEDRQEWLDLWSRWPGREIMAHPEYVRLFARPHDRVVAAILRTETGGILYPLLVRPLGAEPWAPPGTTGCDLTTPYGYGGPFAWSVTPEEGRAFWTAFDAWATGLGVTTSFARLSLFRWQMLPFNGQAAEHSANLVRLVDVADEDLWNDYQREARKNIEIARRAGVTVEFDPEGERLEDFTRVYQATMDRCGAADAYYYPRSFFAALTRELRGHFVFAHSVAGGKIVASELILLSVDYAYSYLGGTLAEAFPLCPNYLLKHESFRWCRDHRRKAVVLGGGHRPKDGIYRYKQHFGHKMEVPFLLGKRTYDSAEAVKLVECRRQWERARGADWSPSAGYYPEYRA